MSDFPDRSRFNQQWGPPDPWVRIETITPPPPPSDPPRRRRGNPFARTVVALVIAGFAVGSASAALVMRAVGSSRSAAPVTTTVPVTPRTTTPPATTVAPSAPSAPPATAATPGTPATTPSTTPTSRAPAAAPTTATPRQAATKADLTTGLVNVTTVLAYQRAEAAGTGIVLTATGEVLTNNHVVDGATKITVTVVATGASYDATVVGTDATDDVAVLQLAKASGLAVAALGDSSTVAVGDAVVAIGNAGGTGTPTTAAGAVTALGQSITAGNDGNGKTETLHDLIEVSAQLQPGQSGGPLYDASGHVVGIDTAGSVNGRFRMRADASRGYAIPINDAVAVARVIEGGTATDKVTIGTPALLGVNASDDPSGAAGALVADVYRNTPAATAGLAAGDLITAVGTAKVTSVASLSTALAAHKAGDTVKIEWTASDGAAHSASVTLIAGPAN